jgi:glutamine synthetase adenylyltransferase
VSGAPSKPTLPAPLIRAGDERWRAALVAAVERAPSPAAALAAVERLVDAAGEENLLAWPAHDLDDLACVLGSSPALTRWLVRFGADWPRAARIWEERNPDRAALERIANIEPGAGPERVSAGLRTLARRELYRIGARDLLGRASLAETLAAITTLAEVAIDTAVVHLRRHVAAEMGDAVAIDGTPIGFVVLGLGSSAAASSTTVPTWTSSTFTTTWSPRPAR